MDHKEIIESFITEFPVCEYLFLEREQLVFSDKVRFICETECSRYGHSWACPPVIGTIQECMERCQKFQHALLITTVTDVPDSFDMQGCLDARLDHEQVSYELSERMKQDFGEVLTLTTGCMTCKECGYPDTPCRHPDTRFATIESHGILIMQTAQEAGISYDCGSQIVTYFTLILYNA
jgi:predicted metal-binding protein